MIRAFLIDDEPLAVARLAVLLQRFGDLQIVGSANDAGSALADITRTCPDVLFVDIEMPGMDGFDLIEAIDKHSVAPLIVFVTAFPRFAVEAFDTGAVDFLTKPVRFDRLSASVERIRLAVQNRIARERFDELVHQLEHMRAEHSAGEKTEHRYLWVSRRGELIRLDLDRLDRVAAEGEYVRLFTNGHEYLHRASVSALIAMLDPRSYIRVHRSHIVRIDLVVGIGRRPGGAQSLILESGVSIPVGRRYRHGVRALPAVASATG